MGGDGAGVGGQGMLTIKNAGVVNVANNMIVWGIGSGARSELDVDSTYTLNVGGTLNFNGGALRFIGDGTDFINDVVLNNIPGPDLNGMHVTVTDGNTATISGELDGNGQLVKEGAGTLILNNINNTYSGGTNINNGTLVVGDTAGFAPFSVFGGGDVNLNGDIDTRLRTPEGTPLTYVIFSNFNANTGQLYTQVGGTSSGIQSDEMGSYRLSQPGSGEQSPFCSPHQWLQPEQRRRRYDYRDPQRLEWSVLGRSAIGNWRSGP